MANRFWRQLRLGLPTLLGLARRGFFIPYRYAGSVRPLGAYTQAARLFDAMRADFLAALEDLAAWRDDLMRIAADDAPPAPRWSQDWFAPLDAAMLYRFIRRYQPRLLIEVGSGHSTRFAARAIADGKLATRHVAIDPSPRAELGGLPVELQRCLLENADPALFGALQPGDMLFIDSSHILMPGTDVDRLFNGILPGLPAGVLVHVHDIFLPDDYPADWAWRGYNEQNALLPYLAAGAYRPLFASRYVQRHLKAETAASLVPTLPSHQNLATSLWLQKN